MRLAKGFFLLFLLLECITLVAVRNRRRFPGTCFEIQNAIWDHHSLSFVLILLILILRKVMWTLFLENRIFAKKLQKIEKIAILKIFEKSFFSKILSIFIVNPSKNWPIVNKKFPDAISEGFLPSYWSPDLFNFVAFRLPCGYRAAPGPGFPERVLSSKIQSEVIIRYHLYHF